MTNTTGIPIKQSAFNGTCAWCGENYSRGDSVQWLPRVTGSTCHAGNCFQSNVLSLLNIANNIEREHSASIEEAVERIKD